MNPIKEYPGWVECPNQCDKVVKRWLQTRDCEEIISVVTGNNKGNMRIGIDGEIRVSLEGSDSFAIPCSLNVVADKSSAEIIRIAKRQVERRNRNV